MMDMNPLLRASLTLRNVSTSPVSRCVPTTGRMRLMNPPFRG